MHKQQSLIAKFMLVGSLLLIGIGNAAAEANTKLWPVMQEAFFAKRDMKNV